MIRATTLGVFLIAAAAAEAQTNPAGGALAGDRPRIIVSSDIGGSDPDDQQSMVHYLVYADMFDTEGLVSSPPGTGRKSHMDEAIGVYETDYPKLQTYSSKYPTPAYLRSISKQGATAAQSGATPPSTISDGAQHIINRAKASDTRPLWVLVWGSATDVAQAVHKDPSIKGKIRLYLIGSWNTAQDPNARKYLYDNHRGSLWWIENDVTFRGMYQGGTQSGDLGNTTFVEQHVRGHGAMGDWFYSKKKDLKMGDTPSLLYLMRGNPNDPTGEHWGGKFWRNTAVGNTFWTDISDQSTVTEDQAKATVNKWRTNYLRDWQARMDRCKAAASTPAPTNQPPAAAISAPAANGQSFMQGTSLAYAGTGTDPEDGALSGTSLEWFIDRIGDGLAAAKIGTGTSGNRTLSGSVNNPDGQAVQLGVAGSDYDLILRVKDSKGLTGEATRRYTVTASGPTNAAPAAQNQTVSVDHNVSKSVTLSYTDPDGPGPYAFTIVQGPSRGTLSGAGGTRTYTPQTGYAGTDTFTWKVSDGLADSNTATATLQVAAAPGGGGSATTPSTYVWDTLQVGKTIYIDRSYTYAAVPAGYAGLSVLRTANNDKGSSGASFVTFTAAEPLTVYVGHDNRFATKPSWLGSFQDTGDDLRSSDGTVYSLFAKDFPAGTVVLGGNTANGVAANSMYVVVAAPVGTGPSSVAGGGTEPIEPEPAIDDALSLASGRDNDNGDACGGRAAGTGSGWAAVIGLALGLAALSRRRP